MSGSNTKVFAKVSGKDSMNVLRWVLCLCIGTAALCAALYLVWPSHTQARARGSGANAANQTAAALTNVSLRTETSATPANRKAVFQALAQRPLSFERNVGQAKPGVEFVSRGAGYSLALSRKDALLSVLTGDKRKGREVRDVAVARVAALRMSLVGANENAAITGVDPLTDKVNYLIGNDPKGWKLHVPHYARVKYEGVYRGIDLVYYGNQRQLEYDFVVAPGADANQIRLSFDGAKSLRLDPNNGDLVIRSADNTEFRHRRPVVYQPAGSTRIKIEGSYRVVDRTHAAFAIASYDVRKSLVIDPTLDFTMSFGGSGFDQPTSIAVDNTGNAFVTGDTLSSDFPQIGTQLNLGCGFSVSPLSAPLNPRQIGQNLVRPDAIAAAGSCASPFVAKISPTGKILFSSYIGNSSTFSSGIAVDSTGVFITGGTAAKNFLTNATYAFGSENAYVADLDLSGDSFHWVVGLGGGAGNSQCLTASGGTEPCDFNNGLAIALDAQHNAYVTGYTTSEDFPTTEYFAGQHKSWQPVVGWIKNGCTPAAQAITQLPCQNGFVAKVPSTGNFDDGGYSTYIGGSVFERIQAIAVDISGHAYVTGYTFSYDFPAVASNAGGPPEGNGRTSFVTKLLPDGSGAMYSSFLGGKEDATDGPPSDSGSGIVIDFLGDAYVTGGTCSTNFPVTPGGYSSFVNCAGLLASLNGNGFVAVLSPLGQLAHSTLFGGPGAVGQQFVSTIGTAIAINSIGELYVGGITNAVNTLGTPTPSGTTDYGSGFVLKLSRFTPSLQLSVLGFAGQEVTGVAVQPPGPGILGILFSQLFTNMYAAGATPKTGSDPSLQSSFDVFVSKWTDFHAIPVFRAQF